MLKAVASMEIGRAGRPTRGSAPHWTRPCGSGPRRGGWRAADDIVAGRESGRRKTAGPQSTIMHVCEKELKDTTPSLYTLCMRTPPADARRRVSGRDTLAPPSGRRARAAARV